MSYTTNSNEFEDDDYSQRVRIDFLEGPAKGKSYNLTDCQSLLVGREPGKDSSGQTLAIHDRMLSRRHLRFYASPQNLFFFLEDLDSTNGTALNGKMLKPGHKVRLVSGDIILAGSTQICFVDSGGTEIQDRERRDLKLSKALDSDYFANKEAEISAEAAAIQRNPTEPLGVSIPPIMLDLRTGRILIKGKELKLSGKQHGLFSYLYQNRERVCTYTELIENIWNQNPDSLADLQHLLPNANNVQQLVREIRRKIDQLKTGLNGDQIIVHNNSLRGYQLGPNDLAD